MSLHEDLAVDEGANIGVSRSRRAEILLAKIAELLHVEPSFFFDPPQRTTTRDLAEADHAELLRIFRTIDDADLRRALLVLIKDLEAKDLETEDPEAKGGAGRDA